MLLGVDLKYPKKLPILHNEHPLAPDKIEIKMLYEYQLKIVNLHNIPIDNIKNLVPNFLIR